MGLEPGVEVIEHDAGLDHHRARLLVEGHHTVQMAAGVDHQRLSHRLSALTGAAAARQHRNAFPTSDLQGRGQIILMARDHHAHRGDLIDRGVGGITAATGGVEQHLALDFPGQARGKVRQRLDPCIPPLGGRRQRVHHPLLDNPG